MDVKQLTEEVERVSQGYAETFQIGRDAAWFVLKLKEVAEKWLAWNTA